MIVLLAVVLVAPVFMPPPLFAAADFSDLLEKKGPRVKEVVARPTVSRVSALPRLPVNARQYEFLIDHPHLSMVLARICDPTLDLYSIETRPDGSHHVYDPVGLEGDVELIGSSPGRRLYLVSGHFMFFKLKFTGHMVVANEFAERPGGTGLVVDSTTTSYIRLNSAFVGVFAKIMAFLFPKKVDERIGRFANAVRSVAIAVHEDPAGAHRKLAATGEISPAELREFSGMFLKKPQVLKSDRTAPAYGAGHSLPSPIFPMQFLNATSISFDMPWMVSIRATAFNRSSRSSSSVIAVSRSSRVPLTASIFSSSCSEI